MHYFFSHAQQYTPFEKYKVVTEPVIEKTKTLLYDL